VKTKALMLPATPVNNRLADLKNQDRPLSPKGDDALAEWSAELPRPPCARPKRTNRRSAATGSKARTLAGGFDGHVRLVLTSSLAVGLVP
jgi:hypothetical protein